MVVPDSGVHAVESYLALAVRSRFVLAFPLDWPVALAFGSAMDVAALDSQGSAHGSAGEQHTPVGIGFGLFLAWPSAAA